MLYMLVERYLSGPGPVYERAAACGRPIRQALLATPAQFTLRDPHRLPVDDPELR